MPELLKPDICVIGAGAGGLSVAAAAAAFGVPVVLIEHGKMGGECLNYGCVPSKSLLAAARRFADLKSLDAFGITIGNQTIDFAKARAHMTRVIAAIAPNDSAERFTGLGVRVIAGSARFTDPDTVSVGSDIAIKAGSYVIATGSSPTNPLINGLETITYYTNETIFDLAECPRHLVIIGGGPVGIEMAQAFRRFGAAVTVIEMRTPLAAEDPECTEVVLAQLKNEGITIQPGAVVTSLVREGANIQVTVDTDAGRQVIEGSHIWVAVGRWPNIDGLDLAAAGVKHNASGITVDARLRTSNKKIYAVGDVTGGPRFTHVANYHAGVVIRNALFRLRSKVDYSAIPHVIFTEPELAQVGLTEAEAIKRRYKIKILRSPYFDNDRAQMEGDTRGHIKVITDQGGTILGVTIVGANAGELITTWTLAIAQRINIRHMAQLVVPYPTLGEVGKRAAVSYFTGRLTSSWLQSIIGVLRRRG
jgi:pyruvate/2-oxoglutarate dehydrogenase complex dihydrolipoamide dehydrogenase (E3) component